MADDSSSQTVGPNAWLVDEMYEQYLADPPSVSESWREFFADYRPDEPAHAGRGHGPGRHRGTRAAPAAPAPPPAAATAAPAAGRRPAPEPAAEAPGEPLRGAAARIVANMEASLDVPTATSFREVPAKLLEVNRTRHQRLPGPHPRRQGQLHPPHRLRRGAGHRRRRAGDERAPSSRTADGKPARRPPRARRPGPRRRRGEVRRHAARCWCPCIKDADTLDFRGLLDAPTRTSSARSAPTSSRPTTSPAPRSRLTNPGTIGTVQSVPRLMPGQGVIVGVGAIDYPAEYQGADPRHAGRPRRVEGHHDHLHLRPPHHPGRRVGAVPQAGPRAAARRGRLLRRHLPLDRRALRGRASGAATSTRSTASRRMLEKQMQVEHAHQHAPGARPPHRRPRPAGGRRARTCTPSSTPPPTGSPSGTSTASSSPAASAGRDAHAARRHPRTCCATPTAARSASSTCTSRSPTEKRWIQEQVEGVDTELDARRAAPHPRAAQRGRGVREVPRHQVRRPEALRHRGRRVAPSRILDARPRRGRRRRPRRGRHGHGPPRPAQRAGQHRGQALRPALQGVRGQRRPRVHPGLGRREVPPRPDGQVRQPRRQRPSRSSWPPTRRTSRPSTRSSWAWPGPSRT